MVNDTLLSVGKVLVNPYFIICKTESTLWLLVPSVSLPLLNTSLDSDGILTFQYSLKLKWVMFAHYLYIFVLFRLPFSVLKIVDIFCGG